MELYYHPLSTYSQKVLIAMHEKGIPFVPKVVDLMDARDRETYEAVYPIGKIPFLMPEEGEGIPESTAIIEYLDDRYPEKHRLIPAGNNDAARRVRLADRMCDLYLNNSLCDLFSIKNGWTAKDEKTEAQARQRALTMYTKLNDRLTRSWICGDDFTLADCAAIPVLFFASDVLPFTAFPRLASYAERAKQRPSYVSVMAEFIPIWDHVKAERAKAAA